MEGRIVSVKSRDGPFFICKFMKMFMSGENSVIIKKTRGEETSAADGDPTCVYLG